MQFRIADSFTSSLAKLTGEEQKAVKMTAFDLQMTPASPGMKFHRVDGAKDKHFWSVRVNRDIRIIVHRTDQSLMLCYVDHHDPAYRWAERRKLERHPKTGAAQLVEIRERVEEIPVPVPMETYNEPAESPALLKETPKEKLISLGVPEDWIDDVRQADEDQLLSLIDHLPTEAGEAILQLAAGEEPQPAKEALPEEDPFEHPDAQRRFRVMSNVEELEQALTYPWEKWCVFLHPAQRELVEKQYNGPARIAGSAGTGKTVVALHRAAHLTRQNDEARVLLTTFSDALASLLQTKLKRLISDAPRMGERIDTRSINSIGQRLYQMELGTPKLVSPDKLKELLTAAAKEEHDPVQFSQQFLLNEWNEVVDAWQIEDWESYRDVQRLGRKTRLPESKRATLWRIFETVRNALKQQGLITNAEMFSTVATQLEGRKHPPYDHVVIDEAQDVSVPQLRLLAALGKNRPDSLFFAGDLGQRIFQGPFSWKALGVDVRGRSHTLHINYRTSHQIRSHADNLLDTSLSDVDGITEDRRNTVSVFNGPKPFIKAFDDSRQEEEKVAEWLKQCLNDGNKPHEIAVFVRTSNELERAKNAVSKTGIAFQILDDSLHLKTDQLAISSMHLAKGLEFRSVAIMACDDEILPLQERIESVSDQSDLEEVYNTERHLLYVACTRARDKLIISGVEPVSEFLDDMI